MILILSKSNTSCVGQILAVNRIVLFHQACSAQILKQVYACASCASCRACGTIGQNGEARSRYVKDFEDVSGTLCCPPPVLLTAQQAKLSHVFNGQNYSSCYMVFIALGIIPTCLCKLTFVVQSAYYEAVLFFAYPIRGLSASKVTRFVAGAQVFSFHCHTVVFHHLNVFCTSGRVLWPGVVISPLSLPSYHELQRTKTCTCRWVQTLYVSSYTSVVNPLQTYIHTYIHTDIQAQPQTKAP